MAPAARLWDIRIGEGQEEDLFAALQEISLPMLRAQPGFRGVLLLRSREDAQQVSYLTLWIDAATMEANVQSAAWQGALARFERRGFQLTEPRIVHYDLVAEEWAS